MKKKLKEKMGRMSLKQIENEIPAYLEAFPQLIDKEIDILNIK